MSTTWSATAPPRGTDATSRRFCPIERKTLPLRDAYPNLPCWHAGRVPSSRSPHRQSEHASRCTPRQLLEAVRQVGAEGIVSKRLGSLYRGRGTRDWLKTKCHETGVFVITGFQELGEGRLEALFVAEERGGDLAYAGQVRFGFAGKGLWKREWRMMRRFAELHCGIPRSPPLPLPIVSIRSTNPLAICENRL